MSDALWEFNFLKFVETHLTSEYNKYGTKIAYGGKL